jgi:anti-anti-sigma factor
MLATMRVETHHDGVPVAFINGEIDASNASALATQIKDTVPNSAIGLVLDLSETSYLDSSGVHLIFDIAEALRRRQQVLQLVVPAESFVGDVLGVVNVGGVAQTSATLWEALDALARTEF